MELQLVEVYIPTQKFEYTSEKLEEFDILKKWSTSISEEEMLIKVLIDKRYTEEVLNFLEKQAGESDDTRALLYNISTYIPRIEEDEEPVQNDSTKEEDEEDNQAEIIRASRQELYSVVGNSSKVTINFTWMLVLSSIVATAGIVKDSAAIVIGAMVIAPLIGPFTAIAFSSILGDFKLMKRSSLTAFYGLSLPIFIAIIFGFVFPLPYNSHEFAARTNVELMDIIVAIAAGAAGALSFIKRVSEALVGVMVSVALLPPAVVLGMTIGDRAWNFVGTPSLLLLVNVMAILLSAIIVFWVSGIKPTKWNEIQAANTSKVYSLIFVSVVTIALAVIIFILQLK
ncbi:TIGR00341 family protein [Saliterribacillus persicus]|uniref:Putative hydrophobic protein (TIGR00341 family) n=1 Tax=Saliterribacillus persicus TaxID=930114 RepID=A0A368XNT7_9BACI|nr:TIGR00341 family protein [Saliterribacillus persicus]RCW69623.1 putative hydrophobic protein (TIGR00341 family) [Saliterribacillus persicus]